MELDITPLSHAIARLEEGLERYSQDTSDAIVRDSLIKRFEFTYEVATRMLKRALQAASASPEPYDKMSFPDMIRAGSDAGLVLSAWPEWKKFREMRNKTSHTYQEALALEVVAGIPGFLPEAVHLRDRIVAKDL